MTLKSLRGISGSSSICREDDSLFFVGHFIDDPEPTFGLAVIYIALLNVISV
ncbi:hypothetical protein [Photobacterium leiognathi]|uniref:hypothetical protein n=1 Tax=Photobacterium leiognathi TaxID=553611 RepID=UPI0029810DD8|nr:hypothetical protein [Photobacterium leiognathi]